MLEFGSSIYLVLPSELECHKHQFKRCSVELIQHHPLQILLDRQSGNKEQYYVALAREIRDVLTTELDFLRLSHMLA